MGKSPLSKLLTNQSGFSLAEVMVAASILGVISLGVMEMTTNTQKTVKHAQQNVMILTLQQKIGELLADEGSCSKSFNTNYTYNTGLSGLGSGVSTTSGTVTELGRWVFSDTNTAGTKQGTAAVTDTAYGTPPVYIESIKFLPTTHPTHPSSSPPAALTGSPGFFSRTSVLEVSFVRTSKTMVDAGRTSNVGAFGNFKRQFYFDVNVIENASGNLVKCFADRSAFMAQFCQVLGGTYDSATNKCDDIDIDNAGAGSPSPTGNPSITGYKVRVRQGLYIGDDASADTNTPTIGARITNGGLYVGTATSGDPVVGTGQFTNSLSVGSGSTPSGVNGEVDIQTNLRVGNDATISNNATVQKDLNVNRSAAFGSSMSPSGTDGDVQILRSLRVGSIADPGAGGLSITGNERVNGTEYVVGTSRNDGDTWARGGLRVGSNATAAPGNNKVVVGSGVSHTVTAGDGYYYGVLATKQYINKYISNSTLDAPSRAKILQYLLSQSLANGQDYTEIRRLISNYVYSVLAYTCPAGQLMYTVNTAGQFACRYPITAKTCSGTTNFVTAISAAGAVTCAYVGNLFCNSYSTSSNGSVNLIRCN